MRCLFERFTVNKRRPLVLSRQTHSDSINFAVELEGHGFTGFGEACAFGIGHFAQSAEEIEQDLGRAMKAFATVKHPDFESLLAMLEEQELVSGAKAAMDMAIHDWAGKRAQKPVYSLLGLSNAPIPKMSVTISNLSPKEAKEQVQLWQELLEPQVFKIKMGHQSGIEFDKLLFQAVYEACPPETKFYVDANEGWSLDASLEMIEFLNHYPVLCLEQPLPVAEENNYAKLKAQSPLPIVVDESCFQTADVYKAAELAHGINIKLMKCGGLAEALRMASVAKSLHLKVMFGCYSNTALANVALAHLSSLADLVDLDSHFNLRDDPFEGGLWQNGCLWPTETPGLGVRKR